MISRIKSFFKGEPKLPNDHKWYHGDKGLEDFMTFLNEQEDKRLKARESEPTLTKKEVVSLLTKIYWRVVDGECPVEDVIYPTLVELDAWDHEANEPKEIED